jgi:hypothetical protein
MSFRTTKPAGLAGPMIDSLTNSDPVIMRS